MFLKFLEFLFFIPTLYKLYIEISNNVWVAEGKKLTQKLKEAKNDQELIENFKKLVAASRRMP